MEISLAFHVVGLVMWIGSLMILTRCLKVFTVNYAPEAQEGVNSFKQITRKIYFGFCLPGALITLLSGLHQFAARGSAYYMKLGWFHAKLTLVVLLFVVTFMLASEFKKMSAGQVLSKKRVIFLHAASSASMIVIVFLTLLNR